MARCVQILPAIGTAVIWAAAGQAQPAGVNIEVSECIALESDLERYACYERLTAAALSEAGQARRSEASTRGPASPQTARAANPQSPTAKSQSASLVPDEIRSSIAGLDERLPNEQVITLENGQVWSQSLAKRYPLRIGQEVRIYPTRWGDSYRLTALDSHGYIQVERIR